MRQEECLKEILNYYKKWKGKPAQNDILIKLLEVYQQESWYYELVEAFKRSINDGKIGKHPYRYQKNHWQLLGIKLDAYSISPTPGFASLNKKLDGILACAPQQKSECNWIGKAFTNTVVFLSKNPFTLFALTAVVTQRATATATIVLQEESSANYDFSPVCYTNESSSAYSPQTLFFFPSAASISSSKAVDLDFPRAESSLTFEQINQMLDKMILNKNRNIQERKAKQLAKDAIHAARNQHKRYIDFVLQYASLKIVIVSVEQMAQISQRFQLPSERDAIFYPEKSTLYLQVPPRSAIDFPNLCAHELRHVAFGIVHKLLPDKNIKQAENTLDAEPYYPVNAQEKAKFWGFYRKGIERILEFEKLLQQEINSTLKPDEKIKLAEYKEIASSFHINKAEFQIPYSAETKDLKIGKKVNFDKFIGANFGNIKILAMDKQPRHVAIIAQPMDKNKALIAYIHRIPQEISFYHPIHKDAEADAHLCQVLADKIIRYFFKELVEYQEAIFTTAKNAIDKNNQYLDNVKNSNKLV